MMTLRERLADKAGSVRALVILLCVITLCLNVAFRPYAEWATVLFKDVLLLVLGSYFGRPRYGAGGNGNQNGG